MWPSDGCLAGPGSLLSSVCEHEALYRDFSREVSEAVLGSRGIEALLPDLAAAGPDRPQVSGGLNSPDSPTIRQHAA